ncbi:hypothetical protein JCM33374_g1950 [Metschnikowia sp. JCM 33374]|nr:hypothetical protein JCM33374_g1950 [Metschnikowia sp. JCM 33374]
MGNDGGTIARGQDLKAVYGNSSVAGQQHLDNLQHSLLAVCSLTSLPLYENGHGQAVVSDHLGNLYLKEKVLELIIRKKSSGKGTATKLPHINGLGDIVDVNVTWSPEGSVICPVTKTTPTKQSTFVYLRPCGCVFSSRLLGDVRRHRKVPSFPAKVDISQECPSCMKPFSFNYDVVVLNPENDPQHADFNKRNFAYLSEELFLGHAKKPLKKKDKRRAKPKKAGALRVQKP